MLLSHTATGQALLWTLQMHELGCFWLQEPCDKDKKQTYSTAQAVKLVVLYPQLPNMVPRVL